MITNSSIRAAHVPLNISQIKADKFLLVRGNKIAYQLIA